MDSAKPRILFIGSGSPWLGGAGYLVRQKAFLSSLADVADLHLAMFDSVPSTVPKYVQSLAKLPSPGRGKPGRIASIIADQFSILPRRMRGYDLWPSRAAVAKLGPETFDWVFAFRIDFAFFAGVLELPNLLLDIDDPEHVRTRRQILATTGKAPDRRTDADLRKLEAFETRAVAGAKLAFVCQPGDAGGWGKPVQVVPNCVDVPAAPARTVAGPVVLFVGNCAGSAVSPNVDAVLYFMAEIWPMILKSVPAAEFRLVGAVSQTVRAAAEKSPRTKLLGFVDDLAGEYAAATIGIAPIRFGTGTRVKIIEAFAHASPVVSTLPGAEGIAAVPGVEIELAVGAAQFAERCAALLTDPELAERIGRAGHRLAIKQYDRLGEVARLTATLAAFFGSSKADR